jgi:hypothetical protein
MIQSFDPKFNFDPKTDGAGYLNLIMNAIDSSDYGSKKIVRRKNMKGYFIRNKRFWFRN